MGQVLQGGAGQAPARQAAIGAGLPEVPATRSTRSALRRARGRDRRSDDPGGRPRRDRRRRHGVDVERAVHPQAGTLRLPARRRRVIDLTLHDGLVSSFDGKHMVEQASFVSRELGITREEQDAWALRSQQRAVAAMDEGRFGTSSSPVNGVEADEAPRRDTSLEKLAGLKPVFDPEGTTTAGNAPGSTTAPAHSSSRVRSSRRSAGSRSSPRSSPPRTSPTSSPTSRAPPRRPGPRAREGRQVDRRRRARRDQRGLRLGHGQLREDAGRRSRAVNVNGGAVALGHPVGASGARILGTMIYELRRNGGGLGLAAICSGGGQGDALLLEV